MVFSLAGLAGVGAQEAYQILENCAGIFYGITYLFLFVVPLAGLAAVGGNVPLWLRLACVAGLATTILYVALAVFPIIDVTSWLSFGLKVGGVIVVSNVIGYGLYVLGQKVKNE
jgi:hypothetical protein